MKVEEQVLAFQCRDCRLFGILALPESPGEQVSAQGSGATRGVLIVTGGPQYRAGSHRQFTLLARTMAECGIPVMRFDYRGMGDSEGAMRNFEHIDDDLRAAVDCFVAAVPGMREVVVWGLCDAASAALFYAHQDARIAGLVLLNPWARTAEGFAKATLKHYYRDRLLQGELWKKILSGRFDYAAAAKSFFHLVGKAAGGAKAGASAEVPSKAPAATSSEQAPGLHDRMLDGFGRFGGKVLLIICGADLTAKEFTDMAGSSRKWRRLLDAPRVTRRDLPGADHTFSRRIWRDQIGNWTCDWMQSW